MKGLKSKIYTLLAIMVAGLREANAQGAIGIDAASSELTSYIDPIGNMILVIGALAGFIGAIRVYIKWNNGEQGVNKEIMGWFGSCIFLVTVGAVLKAFFGV